jgi:CxxC motif-containing protein
MQADRDSLRFRNGNPDISVSGNSCPRGIVYGKEEALSPKRVVTATVRLVNGHYERLPVKTSGPLATEYIGRLLNDLYRTSVEAPVQAGSVVKSDVYGTGIDVITTRSCS